MPTLNSLPTNLPFRAQVGESHETFGMVQLAQGSVEKAGKNLRRALEIYKAKHGTRHTCADIRSAFMTFGGFCSLSYRPRRTFVRLGQPSCSSHQVHGIQRIYYTGARHRKTLRLAKLLRAVGGTKKKH